MNIPEPLSQRLTEKILDLPDGSKTGNLQELQLIILPDGESKVFWRNGIHIGAKPKRTRWLVGELDGVRVYIQGDGKLIMTKQDLYP